MEILWISREELISPQVSFQMRLNWVLHKKKKKNSRCCAGKVYSLLQLCDWARKDSWMRLCPGPHFQQEVKCCMRDGNIPHTFGAPRAADPSSSVQFCSRCLSAFHLFFLLTLQSLRWRGCIFFFLPWCSWRLTTSRGPDLWDCLLLTINGNFKGKKTITVVLFYTLAANEIMCIKLKSEGYLKKKGYLKKIK